jgi:acyl dehydratase
VPFDLSVVGKTFGPTRFEYDWQRVALYALGCGATVDELDVLLETRGPRVLPTFSVVPSYEPLFASLVALGGNMLTLVHGAQRCTMMAPLPSAGRLMSRAKVSALYDKGKGALAIIDTETEDDRGTKLCETQWQIFYRGEGGFGGERGPDAPAFNPPEGKQPDHRLEMPTQKTQALLYRIPSLDLNPIHADPEVAKSVGFPGPILHGLCTFGHAARAAINSLAGGDPTKLKSIEGRFSKPVFPGETIATDLWRVGEKEAYFTTSVKERNEPVITLGRALLF